MLQKSNRRELGWAILEKRSLLSFDLNIKGTWASSVDFKMYLICGTSGTSRGIDASVEATSIVLAGRFTGTSS